jgi:hypothetical protein
MGRGDGLTRTDGPLELHLAALVCDVFGLPSGKTWPKARLRLTGKNEQAGEQGMGGDMGKNEQAGEQGMGGYRG